MIVKQNRLRRIGVITSFLIGLPFGLSAIWVFLFAPSATSGESLPTLMLIVVYGKAILGLIASFVFALWYAGRAMADNLQDGESLLHTSYLYSLRVNEIIWSVLILLTIIMNIKHFSLLLLVPPLIAFLISVGLTTISIGLLISWIVELRINVILENSKT